MPLQDCVLSGIRRGGFRRHGSWTFYLGDDDRSGLYHCRGEVQRAHQPRMDHVRAMGRDGLPHLHGVPGKMQPCLRFGRVYCKTSQLHAYNLIRWASSTSPLERVFPVFR